MPLEVPEVQRCGGWVRFAEGVEVLEMPEAIRCAILCMLLEAMEGRLSLGGVQRCGGWVRFAGGVEVLEMPEAIRCALLCMRWRLWRVGSLRWRARGAAM